MPRLYGFEDMAYRRVQGCRGRHAGPAHPGRAHRGEGSVIAAFGGRSVVYRQVHQEELILLQGEYPDLEVAVLISNADAWSEPLGDCDEADVVVSVVEKEETAGREGRRSRGDGRRERGSVFAMWPGLFR